MDKNTQLPGITARTFFASLRQDLNAPKLGIIFFILFLSANLSALVDLIVHPGIPYFDEEHLIMGGANMLFLFLLFLSLAVYRTRLAIETGERRKSEEALAESEKRFREFTDLLPQIIWETDRNNFCIYANRAGLEAFGYTEEDLARGLSAHEVFAPEERSRVRENMKKALSGQRMSGNEYAALRKDGKRFPVLAFVTPVLDGDEVTGLRGILVDMTESKKAQEDLRKSEARLREAQMIGRMGDWETDLETDTLTWSNEVYTIYDREDLRGGTVKIDDFMRRIHPEDRQRVRDFIGESVRKGLNAWSLEYRIVTGSGEVRHIFVDARVEKNEEGLPVRRRGIVQDITKRKEMELLLRTNEERLRFALGTARQSWFDANLETGEVNVGRDYARLLGYDPESFHATLGTWFENLHPDDIAAVKAGFEKIRKTGGPVAVEYRRRLASGQWQWFLSTGAIVAWDQAGKPLRMSGVHMDINERKRAEETLRQSEERHRHLIGSSNDWIWETDSRGVYTYASPQCREILGYGPEELIGRRPFDLMPPEEAERMKELFLSIASRGEAFRGLENINLHKDGHPVILDTNGMPFFDADGKLAGYRGMDRDITSRKKLDEEVLRSQKLESLGTLAGGIAHDFNNLLQGIFGYISLAKLRKDDREKSMAALDRAEHALHMTVRLTNQLLTFSKGGKPVTRTVDLIPIITNAANFALSGSRSHFQLTASSDLWHAEADEGQIGQVIQNIVLNADQAMPKGGMIDITAENILRETGRAAEGPGPGRYVKISIRDTGAGIPAEHLKKIFDPYYTTKEKGSGLGLATSYSIVRQHGGSIEVLSEQDRGSTFMICLPAGVCAPERKEPEPAAAVRGKSGRVLVMDDEELILNVAEEFLRELSHEPDTARDGEEALRKYTEALKAGKPFDAVILDLTVRGGMGGEEAHRRLREIDPAVKAIVSSGYADSAVLAQFRGKGFSASLNKPYVLETLRSCLAELLG